MLFAGNGAAWGQDRRPTDNDVKRVLDANPNKPGIAAFSKYLNDGITTIPDGKKSNVGNNYPQTCTITWDIVESTNTNIWPTVGNDHTTTYKMQIPNENVTGNSHKIFYAKPGETITLNFQDSGAENLDGFICWYENATTPGRQNLNFAATPANSELRFSNCLAWLRLSSTRTQRRFTLELRKASSRASWTYSSSTMGNPQITTSGDASSPASVSNIRYKAPSTTGTYYVICEASANNNTANGNDGNTIVPPEIAVKTVYEIHVIDKARTSTPLTETQIPVNDATQMAIFKEKFLEHYEIHTPLESGTNYRLSEPLHNYYIPDGGSIKAPTHVRWKVYGEDGTNIAGQTRTTTGNINKFMLPYQETKRYTYYITTEVGSSENGPWYPASLLTVYLEPYMEALTEEELKAKKDDIHYQQRLENFLLGHNYELLDKVMFEKENDIMDSPQAKLESDKSLNYSKDPMDNVDSYYAFANPGDWQWRRNQRMNVGRGEYALYRTLNYPNISKGNIAGMGSYNDYFANLYKKRMVDRLWEQTGGNQSGYFMFLDATDDPGVITKINITGLCPHTSLIVSAWVCDMAHSAGASHADVGFTFKKKVNGEEVILTKYYSGSVTNKPNFGTDDPQAQWQQIFFQFSFPEGSTEDDYILEIANNTPNSDGADYGIDEIKVYKSTPAITAQREDACNASTLLVSSDYATLKNNMSWDIDPNVIDDIDLTNPKYRKYRYGLMGPDPYKAVSHSNVGNVYFSFTDIKDDGTAGDFVIVNKELEKSLVSQDESLRGLAYAMRVAIQTDMDNPQKENLVPTTREEALRNEIILNVYAMNDFVEEVKRGNLSSDEERGHADQLDKLMEALCERVRSDGEDTGNAKNPFKVSSVKVDEILNDTGLYEKYEAAAQELFFWLKIPRIRYPWRSEDNQTLYLSAIDVANTDLKFKDELLRDEDGKPILDASGNFQYAKGNYYVVLFSAKNIADAAGNGNYENVIDVNAACTLKKEIFVLPSISIKVDTETEANGVTCVGEIHTLHAQLMVADVDEYGNIVSGEMKPFEEVYADKNYTYTFDWFLGTAEEDSTLVKNTGHESLQGLLNKFRSNHSSEPIQKGGFFTADDLKNSNLTEQEKAILAELLGNETKEPRLVSGKDVSFRWVKNVVAIPYVYGGDPDSQNSRLFCTKSQELTLSAESDVPELGVGFPDVNYKDVQLNEVPLRLGLSHLRPGVSLTIPIQKDVKFGVTTGQTVGSVLKALPANKQIKIRKSGSIYEPVATLNKLTAQKGSDENNLSLTFNSITDDKLFAEGGIYSLYIPFGEYESAEAPTPIEGSCEGYAVLQIKIVPEYLTWKGEDDDTDAVWHNDKKWNQSTKGELFFSGDANTDANGNDPINKAFSPLYFTKITIPEGKQLALSEDEITGGIQYDMAVNTDENGALKVDKYYVNKVNEIYFKPGATLMNQHFLAYDTARVEFEMSKSTPYWMSSPLNAVYAGDMYAPTATGRQETPAFDYITYSKDANSRWNPAFYQKAWDKSIAYATKEDGSESVPVNAVKANWSIEYNDVWVPYTLGTGFYARVEEKDALVRLPKADKGYGYETKPATRALSSAGDRTGAGKMAGTTDITVTLTPEAGSDGNHFLVGNPYMTYLDMTTFFKENQTLNPKYWTITEGTTTANVGTPDVDWGEGSATGFVAPMTAFFVERKSESTTKTDGEGETTPASPIEVKFTTAMMADKTKATTPATRSHSATAPVLTLTAERDGKAGRSVISLRDNADNAYQPQEDAVVLLDSELDAPVAYSVAGSKAAQVNAVKSINNIPVGVYNNTPGDVVLTIEGISQLVTPLSLYDAQTGRSEVLTGDSHTLHLDGATHGRYFLRSGETATGNEPIAADGISIYSAMPGKVVASATEALKVIRVVDLSGRIVRTFRPDRQAYTFDLPKGIYIIQAQSQQASKVEKLKVW